MYFQNFGKVCNFSEVLLVQVTHAFQHFTYFYSEYTLRPVEQG